METDSRTTSCYIRWCRSIIATFKAPTDISSNTDLIFELKVTDSKNATNTTTVKVTDKYIPPPNKPPGANSAAQTVNSTNNTSCISYDPVRILIKVSCKSATLTDIYNQLKNPDVLDKDPRAARCMAAKCKYYNKQRIHSDY